MREREARAVVRTLVACAVLAALVAVTPAGATEDSRDRHFLTRERLVALFAESGYEVARDERFLEKDLLLVFRPS